MKITKFLKNPYKIFSVLATRGFFKTMSNETYLKFMYRATIGRKLNLTSPKTFNEKLQWLKLYNRKPEYTMMADKFAVREYVAKTIGEEYLIPLLGVWNDPNEIDFDALPDQFVLKCNHNSGLGMCICKDKSKLDIENVIKELHKGLKQDYYLPGREWVYKGIPRKIIGEKYMEDDSGGLIDYKFMCFNGYVDCVMVCIDRHIDDTKFYFFDNNWNFMRLNVRGKEAPKDFTIHKPDCMDKMFSIAKTLSKGIPFVRVDLYECNNRIYFGELTFFPESGFDPNLLPETDKYFGGLINLEGVKQ
jgi:hypothetical protein